MALILLLESSTKNCSVALSEGNEVIALKEQSAEQYIHAEKIHEFVQSALGQANKKITEVEAVAISKGPGSYTGLRIGVSAAKGFAFSLNIPLISVDTLYSLAYFGHRKFHGAEFYRPMLDARRDEVYTALYDKDLKCIQTVTAEIVNEYFFRFTNNTHAIFIGDGAHKCEPFVADSNAIQSILPSASNMAEIANEKFNNKHFEDVAHFEPFYLKDFIPGIAKKGIL